MNLFNLCFPEDMGMNNWLSVFLSKMSIEQVSGWPDLFGKKLYEYHLLPKNHLSVLSIFSGCGGLDIGFRDAGFQIAEMLEINPKYVKTLTNNCRLSLGENGSNIICKDIRNYTPSRNTDVSFVIGGPPCQTFSAAGRRASGVKGTDDDRGNLFREYVRILVELKPRGFLFENVYGITGAKKGENWEEIQKAFSEAGYKLSTRVLDAADYGVPQHRERLFIVGFRKDLGITNFLFPRPTHGPDSVGNYGFYSAGKAVESLVVKNQSDLRVKGRWSDLFNDIPPGLNYSFYTSKLGHPYPRFAWRSKFSDFLYKADPQCPVRTIKAQGGAFTGPLSWKNRHFSLSELKRLQTIPDDYEIVGKRDTQIEQIGNSVPPQMARILALAVLDQFYGVDVGVNIDYLRPEEKLSFRSRKRERSSHYKRKAIIALDRYRCSRNSHVVIGACKDGTDTFSISQSFNLLFDKHPNEERKTYTTAYNLLKDNLQIKIDSPLDGDAQSKFKLQLVPSLEGWDIPLKHIELTSFFKDPIDLTAGWKYIEFLLKRIFKTDDLIQLNGYYQYKPKIIPRITFYNTRIDSAIIKILSSITTNVSILGEKDVRCLSDVWHLSANSVMRNLKILKQNGYDIRNHKTNSQIPTGRVLLPYPFPSLNSGSVYLKKYL